LQRLIFQEVIFLKSADNTLTDRQQETFDFIVSFINNNGYAPSLREIACGIYCSKPVAQKHLESLILKGYITHKPHTARSIVIIK